MQQVCENIRTNRHEIDQAGLRYVLASFPSGNGSRGGKAAQLAYSRRTSKPRHNQFNKVGGLCVHAQNSTTVDRKTQQFNGITSYHGRAQKVQTLCMDKQNDTQASRIRALRESKGWTITDLAKKTGVTYSGAKKWEDNPLHSIRTEQLKSLARVFNVSVTYILNGQDGGLPYQDVQEKPDPAKHEEKDLQELSDMNLVTLTKGELELLTLFHKIQTSPQLQAQVIGYVRALAEMAPQPPNVETLPRKAG